MKGGESVELCKHGISTNTPKNILLGAGAYYKNLMWDSANKRWTGTCLGATSGGGSVSIAKAVQDLGLDGALVPTKGLVNGQGGTATMKINIAEVTRDNLKTVTLFEAEEADGLTALKDKANIAKGDYLTNLAFVGKTVAGGDIIVIFERALCKSGLEIETKKKDKVILTATFECYAGITGDLNVLPVKIYYPSAEEVAQYLYGTPADSGNVILKTGDTYTAYNGAVLPELPEWDRVTYPYATLLYSKSSTRKDYEVIISSVPFVLDGSGYGISNTTYYSATFDADDGDTAWSSFEKSSTNYRKTFSAPMWTNYALTLADGTVMAASDPVPIYNGLVAYSYNGVVLPELPEWDVEKYPYAMFVTSHNAVFGDQVWFYCFAEKKHKDTSDSTGYGFFIFLNETYLMSYTHAAYGEGYCTKPIPTPTVKTELEESNCFTRDSVVWANYEVLNHDGTVYLTESDPIPVYE